MSTVSEETGTVVRAPTQAVSARTPQPLAVTTPAPARPLTHFVRGTLTPYLSRQLQVVGRTGVAGVTLLVFAVAFFFGANSSLRSEISGLQSTLDQAEADHPGTQGAGRPAPDTELRAFMKHLPARAELPSLTVQITAQAAAAGITLERGTYDVTLSPSGQLARARMAFPVHGKYPDIRRFIDGTLAAIPGAAVDALRFERKSVGDAEIDADVRFAVYLRTAP